MSIFGDPSDIRGPTQATTLIGTAAYRGDLDFVKTQLKVEDTDPTSIYHALHMANIGNQVEIVAFLLSLYPPKQWQTLSTYLFESQESDRKTDQYYPDGLLWTAVRNEDSGLIEQYLESGLDPNHLVKFRSFGQSQSLLVLSCGYAKVMKALLEKGARPSHPGNPQSGSQSPMSIAARLDDVECLKLLLDHSAALGTSLWAAVREGNWAATKFLLETGGADVNSPQIFEADNIPQCLDVRWKDGPFNAGTVLNACIKLEELFDGEEYKGANLELAEYLLEQGASLDEENDEGLYPHDYALECDWYWSGKQIDQFRPWWRVDRDGNFFRYTETEYRSWDASDCEWAHAYEAKAKQEAEERHQRSLDKLWVRRHREADYDSEQEGTDHKYGQEEVNEGEEEE